MRRELPFRVKRRSFAVFPCTANENSVNAHSQSDTIIRFLTAFVHGLSGPVGRTAHHADIAREVKRVGDAVRFQRDRLAATTFRCVAIRSIESIGLVRRCYLQLTSVEDGGRGRDEELVGEGSACAPCG